jgi:16S rRNA (cytosine967-C5)-methyltransferase
MWLRVNRRRLSRDAWRARLDDQDTAVSADAPDAVRLEKPLDVEQLPGFREGEVSVQDAGAQLAALLVAPKPGERILDACAAPGGKTGHLLECCPEARVTALDGSAPRLSRVRENLDRLGVTAECVCADAGVPEDWWDGQAFDAILLDAPCTASGVIRRHPDIKLLRRDADVARLARVQARLLSALWPLLRPGGRLIYVTCSVFPEEGDAQVARFDAATEDAQLTPPQALGGWGRALDAGRQLLPGGTGMDGFYYACLVKRL